MDRLPALTLLTAILASGCGEEAPPSTQQRVVAVAADPAGLSPSFESFCDVQAGADRARPLALPPLDRPAPAQAPGSWRWINVWATWCRPCVEEMPMLLEWRGRLGGQGRLELLFLSVDDSPEPVAQFRRDHPATPDSLRLADQAALPGWIASLGLDPGATVPIQVFADPAGRVRCVRSGAVAEDHLPTVQRLIAQP